MSCMPCMSCMLDMLGMSGACWHLQGVVTAVILLDEIDHKVAYFRYLSERTTARRTYERDEVQHHHQQTISRLTLAKPCKALQSQPNRWILLLLSVSRPGCQSHPFASIKDHPTAGCSAGSLSIYRQNRVGNRQLQRAWSSTHGR